MHSSEQIKDSVAVLGGATTYTNEQLIAAFRVGREIARSGKILITGGTTGIPYAAAFGAKMEGATVVGISPGASADDHIEKYNKPLDSVDVMIYTGMGLEGRNSINARSAKGAIFIGGELGTLGEFSAAWTCGNNVLGVLQGIGGVSDKIGEILAATKSNYGSVVIFDNEPEALVRKVCAEIESRYSIQKLSDLKGIEIGKDVREIIEQFLDGENEKKCLKQVKEVAAAVMTTGAGSTINRQ